MSDTFDSVQFVKELCQKKHIKIATLEKQCGFSNGYLRNLKKFPADRLQIIADYLEVSYDYLLNGTENINDSFNSVELVKNICVERKIPISKLEKECGFCNAYIRGLREGVFPADRLYKISNFLNLPIEYLITGNMPKEENEILFDSELMDLISMYSKLSEKEKTLLLSLLNELTKDREELNKFKNYFDVINNISNEISK